MTSIAIDNADTNNSGEYIALIYFLLTSEGDPVQWTCWKMVEVWRKISKITNIFFGIIGQAVDVLQCRLSIHTSVGNKTNTL